MSQEHFALFTNLFVGGIEGKGTESRLAVGKEGTGMIMN